MTNFN